MKGSFVLSCHTHSMIKLANAHNPACTRQVSALPTLLRKRPKWQIQRLVKMVTRKLRSDSNELETAMRLQMVGAFLSNT
jgi:hypothetical protein